MKKLKIAYHCSARTIFPNPPHLIAANAAVMRDLAKEMTRRGHNVTIYAPKGSRFEGAKIIDLGLEPFLLDEAHQQQSWVTNLNDTYRVTYASEMVAQSKNYDIIHFHLGRVVLGEPLVKFSQAPVLFTTHNYHEPAFRPIMDFYRNANLVSISMSQRKSIPGIPHIANIPHGIDVANIPFDPEGSPDTFLFLGRTVENKGIGTAVALAKKLNITLDIYGPEELYFKHHVLPSLQPPITYRGIADRFSKPWHQALSKARALLFPIEWEEPFGLVMIEAMAHGTPVIAFNRGSVAEVLKDQETGFICEAGNISAMEAAIQKIQQMPEKEYMTMRSNCRQHVETYFTVGKMADAYEKLYYQLTHGN